ncbi:MAG: threonylcarbamoyladenosine tRNA methylthiotransferase MtaB [Chloroflexota bacterium]|nr:threonylcarbamoyladenosine tRNA methylthiotransferase MtaB [Chloroflexota bacterium]
MKVFFDTIGCRLNQSEIERMAAQARLNGHEVVPEAGQADVVIINTCAVTLAASADSRKKVRQAVRQGATRVVTTGCYATIAPQDLQAIPGVEWNFSNAEKDEIIERVLGGSPQGGVLIPREALPGKQHRTRAFIKVQDGCDNLCTFCVTRLARGTSRSQPRAEIFADIRAALEGGVKEIVLTGVNLGAWGRDLEGSPRLPELIRQISSEFAPPRLRLSSLEPWDISEDFLAVLTLPGFCRHLHLPLQSGAARTLKRMGRRNTPTEFSALVERIRAVVPEIALTTDIMVGFPGETEADFEESRAFVESMHFAGGHVFSYSLRPGTPAEKLPERVRAADKKARSQAMRAVFTTASAAYRTQFIGRSADVLWEKAEQASGKWKLQGLTDTYLRVESQAEQDLHNQISNVELAEGKRGAMNGFIKTQK